MGLLGKIIGAAGKAAPKAAEKAKKEVVAKVKGEKPFMPDELSARLRNECIEATQCIYHQDTNAKLPEVVELTVSKKKKDATGNQVYYLLTDSGEVVGALTEDRFKKLMIKPGARVVADVIQPIYALTEYPTVYVRRSEESIKHEQELENLKVWVSIDANKWEIPMGDERYDFRGGEFLIAKAGKQPTYAVIGEGRKLFEVTPRMKAYKEIAERSQYKIRRIIALKKTSDYGDYYSTGFYF